MKTLRLETDARGVARVTLARAEQFNVFDETMIAELTEAFVGLDADSSARVVVLAAEGRMFCAGADINWMRRQSAGTPDDNLRDSRRFADMLRAVHECRKPTLACVHGQTYGGGVGLAAAADIVLASSDARFAISEAKFGILPAVIGPYIVRAMGTRQAQRLALTAQLFGAEEAQRWGLVHEVLPAEALAARAAELVELLLATGPNAQAEIKTLYAQLHGEPLDAGVRELSAQTMARVRATEEAQAGFAAFFAKQPPPWKPK